MENDSPLASRKPTIPVTAQRAGMLPAIPPLVDPSVEHPSLAPTGRQPYVIFVNAPSPAVPAVPPMQHPAPHTTPLHTTPATQHFHTTHQSTTHHHHYVSQRGRRDGHSTLGMASLALGIFACVICWIPVFGLAAVPIGAIGALLGILGVVISVLLRRSSAALPAGGVFVCVLAAAISIASTGTLPYWRTQVNKLLPKTVAHHLSPAVSPTPTVSKIPPLPRPVSPAILSATDQLRSAETACADRIKVSDEYRQALQEATVAHASVATLREQSPHSAELIDASRRMIDADNALTAVVSRAQLADPAVQLARQNLSAARADALAK